MARSGVLNGAANGAASYGTHEEPIAIIGMRGRFPGANSLEQYWKNLSEGVESITVLSQEEMRAAGVPDHISRLPGYVNASPLLEGVDKFDAQFFGFSARDATLTDPQHRLFLETAWEALEDSGYDPEIFGGPIGVFGGSEMSTYLYHLYKNQDALKYIDGMQLMVTNDKDHLCTQVSYRLNLKGPSVVVQTTCSTSLVAVSMACESLHHRRCDMALAGGVTVRVPQRGGYFYTAGSILSPDGHCRPFDSKAQGTIVGSGVGLIVLRRLSDALRDGDNIRAVILGTGINNDGNDKVGYTAPSARGQSAAIRSAHRMAGVKPESIGYVEAHGTGTILGDPIEVSALTEVFQESSKKKGFCGIGSVKSNFGHLSCAAGIAGLIKTVLSMEHSSIPPTVHYLAPNPGINMAAGPFYVTQKLSRWERNGTPRRAGVSSFGVGGTNAHIILEEAPAADTTQSSRSCQVFTLSARTETSLHAAAEQLADHLERHTEITLADAASTLHLGRRGFRYRTALVTGSDDRQRIVTALRASTKQEAAQSPSERSVVFMFPGQGSQYPGMAKGLYDSEPVVKEAIDLCAKLLKKRVGADVRKLLFPAAGQKLDAAEALKDTKWAQPALFIVGYALSRLWMSWGVKPAAMIGHSVGEYVAATLAGVMSLEDAMAIIARRGQLIAALPRGSMLGVLADEESVSRFAKGQVSLAAINAPGFSVLSGPTAAIDRVEKALAKESIAMRRLHTSHAFHSSMMDPILKEFEAVFAGIKLHEPKIPFIATMAGDIAGSNVTKPAYWSSQLRQAVRFDDGLRMLADGKTAAGNDPVYIEVGPGNALTTFAHSTAKSAGRKVVCVNSLPAAENAEADTEAMLSGLGTVWAGGVEVDWKGFHANEQRRRVSLPTYPFEKQSYWVGVLPDAKTHVEELRDTSKWMYKSAWSGTTALQAQDDALKGKRILIFDDDEGTPGSEISETLRALGARPIIVRPGKAFRKLRSGYEIDPTDPNGYRNLAVDVCMGDERLAGVIDCWSAAPPAQTALDDVAQKSLLGPMRLAHSLSNQQTVRPLPLLFIGRGTASVSPEDALDPVRALGVGVARVLPQEHPGLRVAHIDVDEHESVAAMITTELAAGLPDPAVALRKGLRHVEIFVPTVTHASKAPQDLPESPVVLITGGLGHMGLHLAESMFEKIGARLVLVGRASLPKPDEWNAASEDGSISEGQRSILKRLAAMRVKRDEVIVLKADLNKAQEVTAAVDAAMAHFGKVDLIVHGAARIDAAAFASAAETGIEVMEAQFSPKLRGLFYVMDAMKGREPQRWIIHSSISSVLGGIGLGAYSAVNALLDVLALQQGDKWLSIDWDAWDNAAEAQSVSLPQAITPAEGSDALLRILASPVGQRILVVVNLEERLKAWVQHKEAMPAGGAGAELHPRPNLPTSFVEPRNDIERGLADIWGRQLGIDSIGIHDRFFDLGGHSLLAAQIASEICDKFQIELPVLKLFQAPTVGELATVVAKAQAGETDTTPAGLQLEQVEATELKGDAPSKAAKQGYRDFYNDVTRRLEQSGVGAASFFLNYGYISRNGGDEARFEVPERVFNRNSVRLAFELIASEDLKGKKVLDVGCGRGGTAALMTEMMRAKVTGMDLSPEAIAFCRKTHKHSTKFEVGDSENMPFKDKTFDFVTNVESSHTYPNLRAFYGEVSRVIKKKGKFLYTDLLPVERWAEVRVLLQPLGFRITSERDITANVLASCDDVAATRAQAFGGHDAMIDNFLAVPGSAVYEQMNSGAWQYRILRAERV
jgi:acyl transferase domain-containing protein/SAM-dependent methyltransferase/acyl carrier protein